MIQRELEAQKDLSVLWNGDKDNAFQGSLCSEREVEREAEAYEEERRRHTLASHFENLSPESIGKVLRAYRSIGRSTKV